MCGSRTSPTLPITTASCASHEPHHPHRGTILWGLLLLVALVGPGCLGRLRHDRPTAQLARAPAASLPLPLREMRPHWLLREEPGWVGAHRVRFGGDPTDDDVLVIRAARFRDVATAQTPYARLTPAYCYRVFRHLMRAVVLVLESIGIPPEQLVPAVAQLSAAATTLPRP